MECTKVSINSKIKYIKKGGGEGGGEIIKNEKNDKNRRSMY